MDEFERHARQGEARRRVIAQRNRAGRLRGRVVAGSLICFALLWGVILAQMASGNDPVLSVKAAEATRRDSRSDARSAAKRPASEAIETTEPDEVESRVLTPEPVQAEAPEEVEPEPEFEPEPEPEPLTTGQS